MTQTVFGVDKTLNNTIDDLKGVRELFKFSKDSLLCLSQLVINADAHEFGYLTSSFLDVLLGLFSCTDKGLVLYFLYHSYVVKCPDGGFKLFC